MTLGSLFSGIGGFELAGTLCGIKPIWSSEIEPFPLKVTAARFPNMKQLGSVTDINGAEIEPVDIITFGSPCQDLSVAGKQLGIHDGQRSNLFFEAIRIIKEMRENDARTGRTGKHIRPRFAVWENVPGAFSSNKGEDFRAVLEAFASVCENDVSIPRPKKWNTGGGMAGHGWSLAWRVYDAQYWGVPQRRKRIYLVADFAGERAGEILFVTEGLRGHSSEGGGAREGTADDAERGVGGSGGVRLTNREYVSGDKAETLRAESHMALPCMGYPVIAFTERGRSDGRSCETQEDVFYALTNPGDGGRSQSRMVCYPNTARALTARHDSSPCVDRGQNVVALAWANSGNDLVVESSQPPRKYIVRRLTPTECARLQGFPDEWCEGLGGSDSAIYKAYGNGLALPCAYDVLSRIAMAVEKEA